MKILVAGAAFKGTYDPTRVNRVLARGVAARFPEANIVSVPLADGGIGTLATLRSRRKGHTLSFHVRGPVGHQVRAEVFFDESGEAVIESAQAAGLSLLHGGATNPEMTSSLGVGQLVARALELGAGSVTIALGDSATVDGGLGLAAALGYEFLDAAGRKIGETGGSLRRLHRIRATAVSARLRHTTFRALCDVSNPLLGPTGAATVFGPQKGATPNQVDVLDSNLERLARIAERDLGFPAALRSASGAGAAGGLGWGCAAWLDAALEPGADFLLQTLGLESLLEDCDLVLVAEGSFDEQSTMGKATGAVLAAAEKRGIPYRVVCARGSGDRVWSANRLEGMRPNTTVSLEDLEQLARMAAASL